MSLVKLYPDCCSNHNHCPLGYKTNTYKSFIFFKSKIFKAQFLLKNIVIEWQDGKEVN